MSSRNDRIQSIINECRKQDMFMANQIAYTLATTHHETGNTFRPVKEAYWSSEEWRARNLRYYPYYGRGYVQITWEYNYEKYQRILKIPLVQKPNLALEPDTARFILVHGFIHGVFTGKKISDYITDYKTNFFNARRCINGTDRASLISNIAGKYYRQLLLWNAGHILIIDGDIGPKTKEKVKLFQKGEGLVADGIMGRNTMAALVQYNEVDIK